MIPTTKTRTNSTANAQMMNTGPKMGISRANSAPPISVITTQSFLDDPECQSLVLRLETNTNLADVTVDSLQKLVCHLREKEERFAFEEKYLDAKKMRGFSEIAKNELRIRINSSSPSSSAAAALNRTDPDSDDLRENRFLDSISKFDKETFEKRNYIFKRQQQCLERFENSWTNEIPKNYRKPSFRLLQLKQVERTLAMSGDYDKAQEIHREAEELVLNETNSNQQKIISDYKNAKAKLLEKQRNEIDSFEKTRIEVRRILETKYENEKQIKLNRNLVVQSKIQQRFLLNSRLSSSSIASAGSAIPAASSTLSANIKYSVPLRPKCIFRASSSSNKGPEISLLPPLIPPTDPKIHEEEEKKRKEKLRQKMLFEKRKEEEQKKRMEMIQQSLLKQQQQQQQMQLKKNRNKNDEPTFITSVEGKSIKTNSNLINDLNNNNDNDMKNKNDVNSINNVENNGNGDIKIEENKNEDDRNEDNKIEENKNEDDRNEDNINEENHCKENKNEENNIFKNNDDDKENNRNNTNSYGGSDEIEDDNEDESKDFSFEKEEKESGKSQIGPSKSTPDLANEKQKSKDPLFNKMNIKKERSISRISATNSSLSIGATSDCDIDNNMLAVDLGELDYTLAVPMDSRKLEEMEGQTSILSQAPSTIDIREYSRKMNM